MYERFFKRVFDFCLSLAALIVLSPLMLVLTACGAVARRGNPFFAQLRPGKIDAQTGKERIFELIKFRTMSNARDNDGNLLPDADRLNCYGKFLRATSLDELPELWNIVKGDMSIVGPRPLLTEYLDRYSCEQRRRHEVRPGLTGYAQVHGRNSLTWEEKFRHDIYYVDHISLGEDVKIIFQTVFAVLKKDGISSETSVTMEKFKGNEKEFTR